VTDHEGAKRREPDSEDEQDSGIITPPGSSDGTLPDDPQSPTEVTGMLHHGLPLDNTTPSFQMPLDLSFTSQGQPTPEFRSPHPEMSHRSLSTTHRSGPILTPTTNQFIDHSQFVNSTSAEQMHAISQTSAHVQPEAPVHFADWSPAFQQNMFSPVDFHGANRQISSQMAYPSYTTYPSPQAQDISSAYTVPDLTRSRDVDMMNMISLPFRTGSLSHPHVLHRPDGGAGPNM
jgi:hypothetical protein